MHKDETHDTDAALQQPPRYDHVHWAMRVKMMEIVPRTLDQVGAACWQPVLEAWWRTWDGIEVYLGSLKDHRVMGSQLLRDLCAEAQPITAHRLTQALVELEHTTFSAQRIDDGEQRVQQWDPMQQSFAEFSGGLIEPGRLSVSNAKRVKIISLGHPNPSREALEAWLLSQLTRASLEQLDQRK